jgi:hypothetical protein
MWTWFKKFLTKKPKHEFSEKQLDQMSKGDRKILQSQGRIKSIYKPYN